MKKPAHAIVLTRTVSGSAQDVYCVDEFGEHGVLVGQSLC